MDMFRLLLMLVLMVALLGVAKAWIEYTATRTKNKETDESGDPTKDNPRS